MSYYTYMLCTDVVRLTMNYRKLKIWTGLAAENYPEKGPKIIKI